MVRLVRGAKWVYGWVVVNAGREIPIPPEAWRAYGFQVGLEAAFVRGSRTSGGFAICTYSLAVTARARMGGAGLPEIGRSEFGDMQVRLPPQVALATGGRLLAVHGSCYGLSFVTRGRIYEEAHGHPEVRVFQLEDGPPAAEEAATRA